jgi:GNAT superfamily N-acetyltransferase
LKTFSNFGVEQNDATSWIVLLDASDAPALQNFFDRNPEYFILCNGRAAQQEEALQEIQSQPPPEMSYTDKWVFAVTDAEDRIVAIAILLSNFIAKGVWLVSLFMVDKTLHGSGFAQRFYQHLENWLREQGAEWIRLGVLKGNLKAEKFWLKREYVQVRERHGVASGSRVNTLRVMVKSICNASIEQYLLKVKRDRPEQ